MVASFAESLPSMWNLGGRFESEYDRGLDDAYIEDIPQLLKRMVTHPPEEEKVAFNLALGKLENCI